MMRTGFCLLLATLAVPATCFTPAGTRTFATFGNAQTKALIRMWMPKPLNVPEGDCLLPQSTENMKRFVRARILLEDSNVGCVASFDDALCVILCRFNRAEHAMLLPLWQADVSASKTFEDLISWHEQHFQTRSTVLSGASLESPDDRAAWFDVTGKSP
jgi:hypothetical protein